MELQIPLPSKVFPDGNELVIPKGVFVGSEVKINGSIPSNGLARLNGTNGSAEQAAHLFNKIVDEKDLVPPMYIGAGSI